MEVDPQRARAAIQDRREKEAIRLLSEAGWSNRELALVFHCSEGSIRTAIRHAEDAPFVRGAHS